MQAGNFPKLLPNRPEPALLLLLRCFMQVIWMRRRAFCVLQAALLPLPCPDIAAALCCCRVLVPLAHPAAGVTCVACFEVGGGLIPVAEQQECRQRCCWSEAFDSATSGCCALPLPVSSGAINRFTGHVADLPNFTADRHPQVDINSGTVEEALLFKSAPHLLPLLSAHLTG